MRHAGPLPLVLWAAALACWAWLWRGARSRTRLLNSLSARYGGFVRTAFSWATLVAEAVELKFVRMCGSQTVRYRLRYVFPLPGTGRAGTVMEFELPEAVFGADPGLYVPGDQRAGRGFFLSGVNLTQAYVRFTGELPGVVRPRIGWRGATVWLFLPGLLGATEEIWVTRCFEFLEELASRTCPPPRP